MKNQPLTIHLIPGEKELAKIHQALIAQGLAQAIAQLIRQAIADGHLIITNDNQIQPSKNQKLMVQ